MFYMALVKCRENRLRECVLGRVFASLLAKHRLDCQVEPGLLDSRES
ncbi:hypothetical protein RBWH47_05122 [Rhodopirellula baltica WH47]|uniref:Uncharacterized protein n=1 Tax=Rhodopirellula baltica WH47 TaxID=991778 RepID=F2AX86_RHOBT|nr:hypothetical protein RBWH47_05122 [Rhodopirellula baltica WH47]